MSKNISSLLKYAKGNRGNIIPKNILHQMQKMLRAKDKKIHYYEILNLYQHLCTNRDESAFKVIDSIIFPTRSQEPLVQPSLPLAYRRLYCLAKYQAPYGPWLNKVRELLHESRLNATDFRYLLTLGSFQNLRLDDNFAQLYQDIITLFEQQADKVDLLTLIALRKHFNKSIIHSVKYQSVKDKLNNQIQNNLNILLNSQLKFLLHNKDLHEQWIFCYFLKCRDSSFKKFGFWLSFLCKQHKWKDWAIQKFTKQEIISKLPTSTHQNVPSGIVEKIFSHTTIQRPYLDEFFQFVETIQNQKNFTKLKNPQKDYTSFLLNAYYYFDSGVSKYDIKDFQKIQQVLSDTRYLKKNVTLIFLYVSIRLSVIYYVGKNNQQKRAKQHQIIKQACILLRQQMNYQYLNLQNYRLLPTKCYRNLGALQFQVCKTVEFREFMEKFKAISNQIYSNVVTTRYPIQFREIENILTQYMDHQKPKQNKLFFGEMKKIHSENQNLQIFLAKQVEVNRKLIVDYLVKVKDKSTGKQMRLLLDFKRFRPTTQNDLPSWKYYWKHHYLVEWCKLSYAMENETPLQNYFQSQKFKARLSAGLY